MAVITGNSETDNTLITFGVIKINVSKHHCGQ